LPATDVKTSDIAYCLMEIIVAVRTEFGKNVTKSLISKVLLYVCSG
jgi:hypothetical protein